MEIIFILAGILFFSAFMFILIEYPYYLFPVFVFMQAYNMIELGIPGPLDMSGLISILLFVRMIFFDKKNLALILELIFNKFFVLIFLFTFYSVLIYFFTGSSLLIILRDLIQKLILLSIGYISVRQPNGKKFIAIGILCAGILCVGDLIFSHIVFGELYIVPLIDYIRGDYELRNYNFYASWCGVALILTIILFLSKNIGKLTSLILLIIFALGILISTSRMTFLTTAFTLILILFTQREYNINFKKIISFSVFGIIIIIMVFISYSFILSEMNISSKVADEIYYRLVEEPLSFFKKNLKNSAGIIIKYRGQRIGEWIKQ